MAKTTLKFVKPTGKNMFKGKWQEMGELALTLKDLAEQHNVNITFELPVSKAYRGNISLDAIAGSIEPLKIVDVIIGTNGKVIASRVK